MLKLKGNGEQKLMGPLASG